MENSQILLDDNILNLYMFGSRVYGTNNENSDYDMIGIVENPVISDDINVKYFTVTEFQNLVDNHDIQALECLFLHDKFKLKETLKEHFVFNLNKNVLRKSISTVSNGSWVKGKKKLTVMADYDKELALKSLFHSIRILNFGIQIAVAGHIFDYSKVNWLLSDLKKMGTQFEYEQLWNKIDEKYREFRNNMSTNFKSSCPKFTSNNVPIQTKLGNLLIENGIFDSLLVHKIIKLFDEYE